MQKHQSTLKVRGGSFETTSFAMSVFSRPGGFMEMSPKYQLGYLNTTKKRTATRSCAVRLHRDETAVFHWKDVRNFPDAKCYETCSFRKTLCEAGSSEALSPALPKLAFGGTSLRRISQRANNTLAPYTYQLWELSINLKVVPQAASNF